MIGVPGEDAGAGQVVVVPGSSSGIDLAAAIVLGQGKDGAAGTAEVGDGVGSAVSVGDGLWVGAPGEDIGRATNAGAVTRFPIKPLKSTSTIEYRQGSAGVPGVSESGDRFGAALAGGGVAIGVPGEDVGRVANAGTVVWRLTRTISQNTRNVPGAAERGDRFGATLASNGFLAAVGVPGEDVGAKKNAGTAVLLNESPKKDQLIVETMSQRAGATETGDRYGGALAFVDDDLVVGIPGEDIGRAADAGAVRVLPLTTDSDCEEDLDPDDENAWCSLFPIYGDATTLVQGRQKLPGRPVAGNRFGQTISSLSGMNGLMVGAPGRTIAGHRDAGSVVVITPAPVAPQELHQNSVGVAGTAESGDRFGTLPNS